jgi:hypothetical protein
VTNRRATVGKPGPQRWGIPPSLALAAVLAATSLTFGNVQASAGPLAAGRLNPGVDNPDFTLDANGTLVSVNCGVAGRPSCKNATGYYPSLSQYPIVSLELARPFADVEGHGTWDGGAYDDVVHGREWNSGPGRAAQTLPTDRLGLSTTAADGVCAAFAYQRVPYPYLGTHAGAPWGHGGDQDCRPAGAAQTDLAPEFTGPAINWLLAGYLGGGTPSKNAPLELAAAAGIDLLGADADLRTAAVVYAYHLLSPASVRAGRSAIRSTLPFGLPATDLVGGAAVGNSVPASTAQIARVQKIGEFLARQSMRSARWGPYHAALQWSGNPPSEVGQTATLRAYVGGCGPAGPAGPAGSGGSSSSEGAAGGSTVPTNSATCAVTSAGAVARAPLPDAGPYGTARAGATWNEDNGIGAVRVPTPTSINGATIVAVADHDCPTIPAGLTCDSGFASFAVTPTRPGSDTVSFTADLADWEPEMWASAIGQDAAFPSSTRRSVSARLDLVIDQKVFVTIDKRSSDPTIAVVGASFELADAAGAVIGTAAVDGNGDAVFGPIDVSTHPVPFTARETVAPVGLQLITSPQIVGEVPYAYSTDAGQPTVVEVTDSPVLSTVRIRKLLSDPPAQPADMSGFSFRVSRVSDHQQFGSITTTADGVTPAVQLPVGTYDVCETTMPLWAQAITDAVGCQRLAVDGSGADMTFIFTNPIVRPETATQLSTPVGSAGATVVESVWARGWQAAGRQVVIAAALYSHAHDAPPDTAICDATTQATAVVSAAMTATATEQVISLPAFTIPATGGVDFYAAGTIVDQETGALVATLPCGELDERVVVASISTVAPAMVGAGTAAHDEYQVAGLPADLPDWTAQAHFELVAATSDSCEASTEHVGSFDEPITAPGQRVTRGSVTIPADGRLYRFRESLSVTVSRPDHPQGWTLSAPLAAVSSPPASSGATYTTPIERCAAEESSPAPAITTRVNSVILSSSRTQPSIDTATITGLGTAALDPAVWNLQLVIGLYWHEPASDPATWVCTAANLVAAHAAIDVPGDGEFTTDQLVDYPEGVGLSSQAQLVGSRKRHDGTVDRVATAPSGCQQVSERQWVPAITTRVSVLAPPAGSKNSDIGAVAGLPADFSGSIRLDIYRFVPGGSVAVGDACRPSMLAAKLSYPFTGSGEHLSPDYAIAADEVAGVQYVHHETVLAADGRVLAEDRCAAEGEVSTITRPQPGGGLVHTS